MAANYDSSAKITKENEDLQKDLDRAEVLSKAVGISKSALDGPLTEKQQTALDTMIKENAGLQEQMDAQLAHEAEHAYLRSLHGQPLGMAAATAADTVWTKRDGKIVYIKMHGNPGLAQQLKGANVTKLNRFVKAMGTFTRFLSKMSTSWNPAFVITNAERDIQTAIGSIYAELKDPKAAISALRKDLPTMLRAIYRAERGKAPTNEESARWYQEFKEQGGDTAFVAMQGIEEFSQDWDKMLSEPRTATKMLSGFMEKIEAANKAVETAARLAVYKHLVSSGAMSKPMAASYAKNLTVNFNRKGTATPLLNSLYMFFNATMQGAYKGMKTMSGPRGLKLMGMTAGPVWPIVCLTDF